MFATEYGDDYRCLVKLGCKGPVVKCNVPIRGWQSGYGGCLNVGGICMACTMPGFRQVHAVHGGGHLGKLASNTERLTIGPMIRYFRHRNIKAEVRQGAGVEGAAGARRRPAISPATTQG